jgi:hypothetical protein
MEKMQPLNPVVEGMVEGDKHLMSLKEVVRYLKLGVWIRGLGGARLKRIGNCVAQMMRPGSELRVCRVSHQWVKTGNQEGAGNQ